MADLDRRMTTVASSVLHLGAHSWAIDRQRRIIAAPVDRLWAA